MKQYYIAPQTAVYRIEPSKLIAESMVVDGTKTLNSSEDILTKKSDSWNLWGSDDDE
jgi:hypothetical protein